LRRKCPGCAAVFDRAINGRIHEANSCSRGACSMQTSLNPKYL
jgi:hypothetical protein